MIEASKTKKPLLDVAGRPLLAIAGKELRRQMRNRSSLAIVTMYLVVLGTVVVVFVIQHGGPTAGQASQLGVQLFQALSIFQLLLILFVTPTSIASTISGERQRHTWDLLLVTRLTSFEILGGKLLAGLAFNILLVFASLPVFGAVFLFGGVTLGDVVRTGAVLLATILLLSVTSLFISVLSARTTVSVVVSTLVSLLLVIGMSVLVTYLEGGPQQSGLSELSQLGSLPFDLPPLTPLAQIDPLVALLSALPNGGDTTLLGDLGAVQHAFGLPWRLPLWGAFAVISVGVTVLLFASSTFLLRFTFRMPRLSRQL